MCHFLLWTCTVFRYPVPSYISNLSCQYCALDVHRISLPCPFLYFRFVLPVLCFRFAFLYRVLYYVFRFVRPVLCFGHVPGTIFLFPVTSYISDLSCPYLLWTGNSLPCSSLYFRFVLGVLCFGRAFLYLVPCYI
jgi:hypothetical protein